MNKIDVYISQSDKCSQLIDSLSRFNIVNKITVLKSDDSVEPHVNSIKCTHLFSTSTVKAICEDATAEFALLILNSGDLEIELDFENQISKAIENSLFAMGYFDYVEIKNSAISNHPVTDYQPGSIRDDFNFGACQLYKTEVLKAFHTFDLPNYTHASFYALRLFASRNGNIEHFNNSLIRIVESDTRLSGQKQFDYVNPQNRDRQIEMEKVATQHLQAIGAYVAPPFKSVNINNEEFEFEASVIIPVRNRIKTLADAVKSVLSQKTDFNFNLLVIDNHSTDGTTEFLQSITDSRLVHLIPEQTDLGIGGCWNEGVNSKKCGRFAVQLDSDDLYLDENTLQKVVDKFRNEQCAMVIGSYKMVNFKLEEIPPGVIDHREWTDDNGPNNALRINGLGAPRAFYTPIIRSIGFPNVSYGEDYAVAIAISRSWKIGRIYDPIYLCRRWDDNTDADLSIEKANAHNNYKDSLRTVEIEVRQKMNIK